jgi:uncharacterized protein (TIRG00374 family)
MHFKQLQKIWLWRLIGPAIVIAAIYWAGPAKVWAVLSKTDIRFVAAAVSFAIPMVLIKGIRWKTLLNSYDVDITLRDSTGMYAIGMVLSAVTPGRIGDMIKIILLIKRGCSIGRSIACNILDRLFDVAFVLLAGYGGMWYFSGRFASQLYVVNVIGVIALALLLVIILKRHLIKKLATKLIPTQYRSAAKESWNEIKGVFWKNEKGRFLLLVFWTIVFWLIQLFAIYLCSLSLGLDISFIYLSACAMVATALSLLPITVAGIGTRDAVFIVLLGQIGIARQESLALSSLVLVVFLFNCAIFYAVSALPASPEKNPASEKA